MCRQVGCSRSPESVFTFARIRSKDTSHDIFINVSTEGSIDLLGNPRTTETRITLFQLDDGLYEFRRGALGAGLAFTPSRIKLSAFSLLEQAVEFQQCRGLDNYSSPLDMTWFEKR